MHSVVVIGANICAMREGGRGVGESDIFLPERKLMSFVCTTITSEVCKR